MNAKLDTPCSVAFGPVLDIADSPYTSALLYSDFKIFKGGVWSDLSEDAVITHSHTGNFSISLGASDVDTLGECVISINKADCFAANRIVNVLTDNVYDSLVAGTEALSVDAADVRIETSETSIRTNNE